MRTLTGIRRKPGRMMMVILMLWLPCSGAWALDRECAREFLGKLVLGSEKTAAAPATANDIRSAIKDSIKKGLKPKVILAKAGKFLFYPTVLPNRVFEIAAHEVSEKGWRGLKGVPLEYIRQDGLTALGFAVFYKALEGTPVEFVNFYLFSKNHNGDFVRDTASPERKDGITVYVDGVPGGNVLHGYGEKDFATRFRKREGAVYIHAKDPKDMMEQIQKAAKEAGKPVAELEILGHGMPGMIEIGNKMLDAGGLHEVEGSSVPFAKDALIRIQSCYLGANFKYDLGNTGEKFMSGLGSRLLDHGGRVVASNRIIYVTENFSPEDQKSPPTWADRVIEVYSEPFMLLTHATFEALLEQQDPYREVRIPPRQ